MEPKAQIHVQVQTSHVIASGVSDPGRMRSENEDSIFLDEKGRFMLLADGMGGHERGAEASETALKVIQKYLRPDVLFAALGDHANADGVPPEIICASMHIDAAVRKANSVLYKRSQNENLQRYMGTTVVGLIPVKRKYMLWFHVGDSRLYRWRDSVLKCLTVDHSAYSEWVRQGKIGTEPGKHVITKAVGPHATEVSDIGWDKQAPGDTYILCSDGLTDMLAEEQMAEILRAGKNADDIARRLIAAANEGGGTDNVSAVVCRI